MKSKYMRDAEKRFFQQRGFFDELASSLFGTTGEYSTEALDEFRNSYRYNVEPTNEPKIKSLINESFFSQDINTIKDKEFSTVICLDSPAPYSTNLAAYTPVSHSAKTHMAVCKEDGVKKIAWLKTRVELFQPIGPANVLVVRYETNTEQVITVHRTSLLEQMDKGIAVSDSSYREFEILEIANKGFISK